MGGELRKTIEGVRVGETREPGKHGNLCVRICAKAPTKSQRDQHSKVSVTERAAVAFFFKFQFDHLKSNS